MPKAKPTRTKRTQKAELQFFIRLPNRTGAEAFADQLIKLTEKFGGSVAGGVTLLPSKGKPQ